MSEFRRESAEWLYTQVFFISMTAPEQQAWLEYRERVTLQYEDPLFHRSEERERMEQEDVIEMSHYTWDARCEALAEYQHAWRVLGDNATVVRDRFRPSARNGRSK